MVLVQTWGTAIISSLQEALDVVLKFLPSLIGAIIIFLIGWAIAAGVGRLVKKILNVLRVNEACEKIGIKKTVERGGFRFDAAGFLGALVKWFLIIVFFMAAVDILGLTEVTDFLRKVVLYLPNVIVAVLILLVGIVVGNFLHTIVEKSVKASRIPSKSAGFLATLTKWSVVIFSLMAALVQLRIASQLIETLFTGVVALLAIAGGIAFGLGGKEHAKEVLDVIKKSISGKSEE